VFLCVKHFDVFSINLTRDNAARYALNQLLRGCNVGLVATLAFKQDERTLQPTRDFCVATTHVFSRAEAHGIKLWQVGGGEGW